MGAAAFAATLSIVPVQCAAAGTSTSSSSTVTIVKDSPTREHLRVLAQTGQPGPGGRVRHVEAKKIEVEPVTFLGVETGSVSQTLVEQLALPNGTGLVVLRVVPASPATDVLKSHDILLKLDDQILVDQRQLSVLVRNRHEGDEVTLTYVRAGKQATAKIKLGKHDAPKLRDISHGNIEFDGPFGAIGESKSDGQSVQHVLSMIRSSDGQAPVTVQIDGSTENEVRATRIDMANTKMLSSDDAGSLELTVTDGKKSLVAKNTKGVEEFSGPITSPEERKALPPAVRERLEKLEAMNHVSFQIGGDFKGAETRVVSGSPDSI